MTTAHFLYIPTIFMLGFLAGMLLNTSQTSTNNDTTPKYVVSGRILLTSFLVFAFSFVAMHFLRIPRSAHAVHHALNGAEIFDKKPSFGADEVYERIASFPQSGIYLYKQFTYTTDVLFPLTLLALLILLTLYIGERAQLPQRHKTVLMAIPLAWFGFDVFENVIVFTLLSNFPSRDEFLAGILGLVTIIKFSLLLVSIAVPIIIKVFEKAIVQKFIRSSQ